MEKYYTFIDETGDANPDNYQKDPFYTVTAILMSEKVKEKILIELSDFKLKYFGSKNYILHRNKIISTLKYKNKNIDSFIKDLKIILSSNFFIFQVLVNQEKAFKKGWVKLHVYKQVYRILLSNIVKFSIARNVRNIICSEASSVSQDINIYKSFFHYIANGIGNLDITSNMVKTHFTSLNFVTKINNDAGEQLADLFSKTPIVKYKIENKLNEESSFNKLDKMLFEKSESKLHLPNLSSEVVDPLKKKIYPKITLFKVIP